MALAITTQNRHGNCARGPPSVTLGNPMNFLLRVTGAGQTSTQCFTLFACTDTEIGGRGGVCAEQNPHGLPKG